MQYSNMHNMEQTQNYNTPPIVTLQLVKDAISIVYFMTV